MATDNSEANRAIHDAVQTTLDQFGESVRVAFDGLCAQLEHEQTARTQLTEQVQALAIMVERAGSGAASEETLYQVAKVNRRMDTAVADARVRQQEADDRQDEVERDLKNLRTSLEKFDSQAARMVSHVVEVTTSLSKQVEEVEGRVNGRAATTEARITEELGQRIADVCGHIGRVRVGLDESITVLNNRTASSDSRLGTHDEKFDAMAKAIEDVDAEVIDDLKDRVRSAAGETELVRIEMERFQATMGETVGKTMFRLAEVETQLQDQAMDTETAVQLERLEEVERALIALDPRQFVRVDGSRNSRETVEGYGVASEPTSSFAPPGNAQL